MQNAVLTTCACSSAWSYLTARIHVYVYMRIHPPRLIVPHENSASYCQETFDALCSENTSDKYIQINKKVCPPRVERE